MRLFFVSSFINGQVNLILRTRYVVPQTISFTGLEKSTKNERRESEAFEGGFRVGMWHVQRTIPNAVQEIWKIITTVFQLIFNLYDKRCSFVLFLIITDSPTTYNVGNFSFHGVTCRWKVALGPFVDDYIFIQSLIQ